MAIILLALRRGLDGRLKCSKDLKGYGVTYEQRQDGKERGRADFGGTKILLRPFAIKLTVGGFCWESQRRFIACYIPFEPLYIEVVMGAGVPLPTLTPPRNIGWNSISTPCEAKARLFFRR